MTGLITSNVMSRDNCPDNQRKLNYSKNTGIFTGMSNLHCYKSEMQLKTIEYSKLNLKKNANVKKIPYKETDKDRYTLGSVGSKVKFIIPG